MILIITTIFVSLRQWGNRIGTLRTKFPNPSNLSCSDIVGKLRCKTKMSSQLNDDKLTLSLE